MTTNSQRNQATALRPARQSVSASQAQNRILEAVDDLFYREGARAVGVDAVVKQAGVNKMSLYRQFKSKEALLLFYLERGSERFWRYFEESLAKHPNDPRKQLVQYFADLAERAQSPGYRGCRMLNVALEFPDPQHAARKVVSAHRARVLARLIELAQQCGANDAAALAEGLALLMEGGFAASQTYGAAHPMLAVLPATASALINAACAGKH